MSFTLRPAVGENFVNREEIINEMIATLTNKKLSVGFALIGNRRIGKTSIFQELYRILKEKKSIIPIYFSLWSLIGGRMD